MGFAGIPYDCATSMRPGARFAPNAIRAASVNLIDGENPIFEIDPSEFISDFGDINVTTVTPEKALYEIEIGVDTLQKDRHMIFAGGDHLTTLGVLRSMYKRHGKMAMIHVDAHCDTWSAAFGEQYGHGTWLYNAISEGLIDPTKTVSIGIRSPVDRVTKHWLVGNGGTTISARTALKYGISGICDRIETKIGFDVPTYLSFDIDSLDPAFAPATGTPEPGGLTSMFAMELIENLKQINFVGMDLVEVCPPYDNASAVTSLVGANLLWTYAAMMLETKRLIEFRN